MKSASEVLSFWFDKLKPEQHFKKDEALDQDIRLLFADLLEAAAACELWSWRSSIKGRLAEIIILDQFSRNIHRGSPHSFSQDPLALALAQETVAKTEHLELPASQRAFLYMPYMHSESLIVHDEAVRLFSQPGLEMNLDFEMQHKRILEKFGRYPHRNEILGRKSTAQEIEFLNQPGSSF